MAIDIPILETEPFKRRKIYICGPITGYPDGNKAEFNSAAERINAAVGYMAVNPHTICADIVIGKSEEQLKSKQLWKKCMVADIKVLVDCDLLVTLPGCKTSKGAQVEIELAKGLGIPVYDLTTVLDILGV